MCERIQSKGLRPKLQIFHTYDKYQLSQRQNILKQMENGENALHPYFMYIQLSERNDEMLTAWSQNRKQFPFGKWRRRKNAFAYYFWCCIYPCLAGLHRVRTSFAPPWSGSLSIAWKFYTNTKIYNQFAESSSSTQQTLEPHKYEGK